MENSLVGLFEYVFINSPSVTETKRQYNIKFIPGITVHNISTKL